MNTINRILFYVGVFAFMAVEMYAISALLLVG